MKLAEAKQQFINNWGVLSSDWGINRTMAQIHALLLVSDRMLCTDDIMEQLSVSRGNANMNIRELINWNLVSKIVVPGDRKEYFSAEKDIWKVAIYIMYQRKKRELDPMIKVLNQISIIDGDKNDAETKAFMDTIKNVKKFAEQADKTVNTIIKAEENWFWSSLVKILR